MSADSAFSLLCTIDEPVDVVVAGLPFALFGWAAASGPISEIAIFVDAVPIGLAMLGYDRPDVALAYPHLAEAGRSGFRRDQLLIPDDGRRSADLRLVGKTRSGEIFESGRKLRVLVSAQEVVESTRTGAADSCRTLIDVARAFLRAERVEEAEILAAEAMERFPGSSEVLEVQAMAAMTAADRSNPAERQRLYSLAQGLWARLREQEPLSFAAYHGEALAGLMLNTFNEAEAIAAKAVALFPTKPEVFYLWAESAAYRRDWAEAIRRWREGAQRFPGQERFLLGEKRTRYEAGEEEASSSSTDRNDQQDHSHRDLMLRFEGLGHNCDFGMVQRQYGAEPLGLLRFASVPLGCLLNGLATRFEGVGQPENTVFSVRPHPRPEYWVGDTRLDLLMHTFIYPEDVSPEQERQHFQKQCKRMAFLARKLVEDLEEAEKIFVYQTHEALTEEQMRNLLAALRRYGDNTLLCIQPSDETHLAGTVEVLEEGLLIGRVSGFTHFGRKPDFENWRAVCSAAYRHLSDR